MEKSFFEAFPNLKLEGVQRDLFEQVMVDHGDQAQGSAAHLYQK